MIPDSHIPSQPDNETLSPEWIEVLRSLPSEKAVPSAAVDSAILSYAKASLDSRSRRKIIYRLWPTLAAAACLVFVFTFFSKQEQKSAQKPAAHLTEDKYTVILREVSAVFPHQVKAITTDGGELQIALSDEMVAEDAQAVVIEACGNGACTVVITYVGQTVKIARQQVTVRVDKNGAIIIVGQQEPAPDLQIKTRNI